LPALVTRFGVRRILLALPSVSRRKRQEIIASLEGLAIRIQTVPDIADLIAGRARVDDVRDVDVADLLGREIVPPNEKLLGACITGKTVLVTGAGGSIGSELCRQIARLQPVRLVLYERSEAALFQIDHELRQCIGEEGLDVELVPVLGSVLNPGRLRRAMTNLGVQAVYHAAAYKHVPLVEYNMTEGVYNNAIGTWHAAEAACAANVETFVLISTDKAVMPVNVMGASKRFAELLLQAISARQATTRFCMVRFGNVLDSSGSVVPVFREQIRRGGPVTVTHRDIIRYFMTIPEAAQLVLQAGSMCKGGDVFVLDMGEPVRIADLARRMINLMGFSVRDEDHPEGDIEIQFIGLRPAEKLYEELLIGTNVSGTEHPMIMRAMEDFLPWDAISRFAQQLEVAAADADCDRVRALLLESVDGYRPENGVDDLLWQARRTIGTPGATVELPDSAAVSVPALATVTDLAARRAGAAASPGAAAS
ncbi:MAG: polysaccharide biosynthesis protein, partial [Gammaproteobacteria bacterium PRO9]|nr:polysaccharide biosynthesis protein [Gammaproteobacteria bacterium PRO9]